LALGVRPTLDVLEDLTSRDRFDEVVAHFGESADFDDRLLRRLREIVGPRWSYVRNSRSIVRQPPSTHLAHKSNVRFSPRRRGQARADVTNAVERDTPLDEAFFSTIQSPVRCKRADVEVTVDGINYAWKFAQ
jgi:hypothetical protein